MSESADGALVTATRQNDGRAAMARASAGATLPPGVELGGMNPPAAISAAEVTVARGRASVPRLAHETAAAAGPSWAGISNARTTQTPACVTRIMFLLGWLIYGWPDCSRAGLKASTTYR